MTTDNPTTDRAFLLGFACSSLFTREARQRFLEIADRITPEAGDRPARLRADLDTLTAMFDDALAQGELSRAELVRRARDATSVRLAAHTRGEAA